MSDRRFGLLLVAGNQTHQEQYARAFAADPRCRLIGLTNAADVSPRRRELDAELAGELGIPTFDDLDAALARDDVDFVSILADPERRGAIAIQAARAGKHVYLDKEPAVALDELRAVEDAIREAGTLSQSFSLVRSPIAQQARRVVESGRLGELLGLHAELFFAKGIAGTADLSRPRRERTETDRFTFIDSKRELLCVGWYPLILMQWLTGQRVESVSATTSNYFFAEHQRNGVEDFACVLVRLAGGIEATIAVGRTGWCSHPSHGVNQVQLVGTRSATTLDAFRPRLEIHADAPPWTAPTKPHPEDPMGFWGSTQTVGGVKPKIAWQPVASPLRNDFEHFLDCLERNEPSDVDVPLAAHTVRTIFACYESAATGRTVRVA